ncbi:DM13 domain-containing protein [Micromonospora sp. CPCC 206060]|uniref:DM13 domain-containing protein n=1 Tax=Micromonospora sp. CPCC 206060 TaxID=3122406 RepID=UPI002FF2D3E6
MLARLLRTPLTWIAVAVIGAGTVFGLYWFQPWKLVTDDTVDEALSDLPTATAPGTGPTAVPSADRTDPSPTAATLVSAGEFISHEHETTGQARIVRQPDGSYRLEIVGLSTSNGPDLRIWLTDQPVRPGTAGCRVFDDGRRVELGRLKGNRGDQVYPLPAGVDPASYRSVSIWCKRFSVSFGAAPLAGPTR